MGSEQGRARITDRRGKQRWDGKDDMKKYGNLSLPLKGCCYFQGCDHGGEGLLSVGVAAMAHTPK